MSETFMIFIVIFIFLFLPVGAQKFKTKVEANTVTPNWNEAFEVRNVPIFLAYMSELTGFLVLKMLFPLT